MAGIKAEVPKVDENSAMHQERMQILQVKLREDPTKGGWSMSALEESCEQLQGLSGVSIVGLMTMAPQELPLDGRIRLFRECRALADRFDLPECSMGMSGDWRQAAAAGATWLRQCSRRTS